jgi:hypothetical protein
MEEQKRPNGSAKETQWKGKRDAMKEQKISNKRAKETQ